MPAHPFSHYAKQLLQLLAALLIAGCAAGAIDLSRQQMAAGQNETALQTLEAEMRQHPNDAELRIQYYRTRDQVILQALTAADRARDTGRTEEVETQAKLVLRLVPDNARAQAILRNLEAAQRRAKRLIDAQKQLEAKRLPEAESIARALLAESPNDAAARALLRRIDELSATNRPLSEEKQLRGKFTQPVTLEFRDTPLRSVFEALSRTGGINFVFDKDVKTDARITVFVRNTSLEDVLRLILTTNQLERKLLNENSVIIYPASPAKQKDYQELATRTFYLTNTDAKQAQALIKAMVKSKDTFIDEQLNLLVIKDTPEAIRLAEQLMRQLDVPPAEVMLEVEVLEVQRSKLLSLGIKYPDQIGYGLLQPTTSSSVTTSTSTTTSTTLGGQLASGYVDLGKTGSLVPFVANPGLLLNIKDQNGVSNVLANPRIRVRNKEKAKIHIGDKLPVFTTTSTANVGVSASVNYLDVGLKLDVEPTVRLDDEVEIKVGLEVSSVSKEVSGPQNSLAYQVGTRNADTVLRLRDGETQVLAGLISDEERSSMIGLPGLGRIPGLGRLFSTHSDSGSKTEIVLLITPRILRNVVPEGGTRAAIPAGTESAVGAAQLTLSGPTPAGTLKVSGGGGSAFDKSTAPPGAAPVSTGAPIGATSAGGKSNNAPLSATLSLIGAGALRAGQDFDVTIMLSGSSEVREAEVTLNWDKALFDAISSNVSGNSAAIKLSPSGNSATSTFMLRAKNGKAGEGPISLSNPHVALEAGEVSQINTPAPLTVKVQP